LWQKYGKNYFNVSLSIIVNGFYDDYIRNFSAIWRLEDGSD